MWENELAGKGRERHLFLFKGKLLITKKKKSDKSGEPPSFEFDDLIEVQLDARACC